MKVIMLSIDSSILCEGSEVQERMKEYGRILDELHIIVYSGPGFKEKKISENIWIYPTNTVCKPLYFFNAYKIGQQVIGNWKLEIGNYLVTSQDALTSIVAIFLKKKFGIPFQAQIHTDFLSPNFRRESWKNYIRYRLYSWSIKKADCIRVVSERLKKSIVSGFKIHDSRISVLPIFVDIEKIKNYQPTVNLHEKYPGYDFIILMASRLTREKNIESACQAMQEVAKKFIKILLLIVGDGPLKIALKEKYKNLVDRPGVSLRGSEAIGAISNIVFEDAVPYETLISYYKTADLFLLTSNYEGYGRTIIEALTAGLPVFSTDVGIAREMIRDGEIGAVFKGHNSQEISSCLVEVLAQNKIRGMKLKTREFAQNFSMLSKEEYLLSMKMSFESCKK